MFSYRTTQNLHRRNSEEVNFCGILCSSVAKTFLRKQELDHPGESKLAMIMFIMLFALAPISDWVVINEILYDPPGKDEGCFVELLGTPGLKLDGFFLVGVDGDSGRQYNRIDLSGHKIPSSGYFVIAQDKTVPSANLIDNKVDYHNGPDNIELWCEDKKVDSVGYGDFSKAVFTGEGSPAFDLPGHSIGRRPDGLDTNDNSVDFVGLALVSPGMPNTPKLGLEPKGKSSSMWGVVKR